MQYPHYEIYVSYYNKSRHIPSHPITSRHITLHHRINT